MRSILNKCADRRGESIAEVLVALLISVLGVSLLVGMVGASVKIINESTTAMQEQYALMEIDPSKTTNDYIILSWAIKGEDSEKIAWFSAFSQKHTNQDGQTVLVYYVPNDANEGAVGDLEGDSSGDEPSGGEGG